MFNNNMFNNMLIHIALIYTFIEHYTQQEQFTNSFQMHMEYSPSQTICWAIKQANKCKKTIITQIMLSDQNNI